MNGTRVHRNMHGLEASDDALAGPCDALASLPTPPFVGSYDSEGNAQVGWSIRATPDAQQPGAQSSRKRCRGRKASKRRKASL